MQMKDDDDDDGDDKGTPATATYETHNDDIGTTLQDFLIKSLHITFRV